MSFSEKLYGGAGWLVGGVINVGLKGAGVATEALSSDGAAGRRRRESLKSAGDRAHDAAAAGGRALGRGIAKVATVAAKVGAAAGGAAAEAIGASPDNVRRAQIAGAVLGAAGTGVLAGEVLMTGVVDALGAVDGLAGAAAVAHGERVIGSVVGGGQAAGQAIEATVVSASAVSALGDASNES